MDKKKWIRESKAEKYRSRNGAKKYCGKVSVMATNLPSRKHSGHNDFHQDKGESFSVIVPFTTCTIKATSFTKSNPRCCCCFTEHCNYSRSNHLRLQSTITSRRRMWNRYVPSETNKSMMVVASTTWVKSLRMLVLVVTTTTLLIVMDGTFAFTFHHSNCNTKVSTPTLTNIVSKIGELQEQNQLSTTTTKLLVVSTTPKTPSSTRSSSLSSTSPKTEIFFGRIRRYESRFKLRKRIRAALERTIVNHRQNGNSLYSNIDNLHQQKQAMIISTPTSYSRNENNVQQRCLDDESMFLDAKPGATPPKTTDTMKTATANTNDATESRSNFPYDDDRDEEEIVPLVDDEILPFQLPVLSNEQLSLLRNGERVQQQSTMSREGSGYVVMDIPASEHIVWEALLNFTSYPENIGTVRSMKLLSSTGTIQYGIPSTTRASFVLSKFALNVAAIHRYSILKDCRTKSTSSSLDHHYMEFTLDESCTNIVLKHAKGIWYTQKQQQDGSTPVTRVWLLCELRVSSLLPQFIVDYAAKKAMPRATNWLRPTVEKLLQQNQEQQ